MMAVPPSCHNSRSSGGDLPAPPPRGVRPPRPRPLRDPIQHDPQEDDREPGGEALTEEVPASEPGHDVVAERLGPDEPAHDDHREHEDDALVRRPEERRP